MQTKKTIFQTINTSLKLIVALSFTMILSAFLKMSSVLIVRKVVDDIHVLKSLALWVTLFIGVLISYFIVDSIQYSQKNHLGERVSRELKKQVYSVTLRAELGEISKLEKSEIKKSFHNHCDKIGEQYISKNIVPFISNVVFLVTVFITGLVINPLLTMVVFGSLPVYFAAIKGMSKINERSHNKQQIMEKQINKATNETFDKIRNIKLKNGVIQVEEQYQQLFDKFLDTKSRYENIDYMNRTSMHILLTGVMIATVIGLGGLLIKQNIAGASIGDMIAFVLFTPIVYHGFHTVLQYHLSSKFVASEIEEIDRIMNIRSEIKSEPIASLDEVNSLKFVDVFYTANKMENSVSNLSFELKRGEKLGVLSLSGNAKATIFDLATKINRPKEGMISINNCDVNKLDTFYLRSIVTAVPQDDLLFSDSIEKNITYPLEFDEYQYNDALNRSGLKAFIAELEEKDQTIVDCDSEFLNEDIKQRIILANAFYKDSKIFILNEATSSLDPRSEDEIMQEIYKLKNKIVIVMSDRAYNLLNCDKIMILEDDKVVEYGKTEELLHDRESVLYKQIRRVKATKVQKIS